MIGAANSAWIPCIFEATNQISKKHQGGQVITNIDATDFNAQYILPKSTNRGGLKLYIKGLGLRVQVADADDYIDTVTIFGRSPGIDSLYTDGTNRTAANKYTYTFTAVDCSTYDDILAYIDFFASTLAQIQITSLTIDCYYDV